MVKNAQDASPTFGSVDTRVSFATIMGGPGLEIFKFSLYLFVPVAALIHFGDPDWYRRNVLPASAVSLKHLALSHYQLKLSTGIVCFHLPRQSR